MTQQNLLSSLRAILTIIGSYVVGRHLFGQAVTDDTWQVIVGAATTVAMTIWGIASKTSTIEGIESAVRSVITSVGGILVSAGMLSGNNLNAILGLITAIAPLLQSVLSKAKNGQIANGNLTPSAKTGQTISKP